LRVSAVPPPGLSSALPPPLLAASSSHLPPHLLTVVHSDASVRCVLFQPTEQQS
jgi:hypothetical protein